MPRKLVSTTVAAAASGLAFLAWTWLALGTSLLAGADATSASPGVDLSTGWGQLTSALSFVLHPYVTYAVVLVLAAWCFRRRLRNLGYALLLGAPAAWASERLLKMEFGRPRPPTRVPLVTSEGLAYPSGHMVGISVLIVFALAIMVVTQRRGAAMWLTGAAGVLLWLLTAYNRWALRAHYVTDIVAGGLWGAFVASAALLAARVHVVAPWAGRVRPGLPPTLTVIVNPTRVPDWGTLRRQIDGAAREHGWGRPHWVETSPDDSGLRAARRAVDRGVDLVLVAGGDGTVRACCQAVSGTPVALGILPVGTGNLLARNLGIPLDAADALDAALDGVVRTIDLVEVRADGGEPQTSAVMAGMGVDAIIMSETNPDLKRAVGPAAYVMTAVTAMSRPPFELTVQLDDDEPALRELGLAMVANVGMLQGGVPLMPDARPDDGRLDVLLALAKGPFAWANMASRVITGLQSVDGLERGRALDVRFSSEVELPYQIDGDTAGVCRVLEATVRPRVLSVMVPR